ncbi:hypothetical protein DICPUDRAFT_82276 [Dictyostelium purpureum]|uniref:NIPSNAP domain-containing protein n=1 Tax=Dictyostelium purpureum TaxID=5786 RepID=F0ZW24_DICPU|nr:uncharacterized protein DICPUDRAFT_82276 [Dictyostelium purpureum]EGC31856.1 hypothetical protein DICPUDRAFT_82276 [Dictyostelium purpureum]|eukprot:XP_003291626.1 hypothetical protein DICPUDRAFT_82276 [Dictyostelium purpureum]
MLKRFYSTVPKEFIYELKTYNVPKNSIKELNNAFKKINPNEKVLTGAWVNNSTTSTNQVYALWRFESLDQRKEIKQRVLTDEITSTIKPFEKDSSSIVFREYPWAPTQLSESESKENKVWDMVTYETKPGQLGSCGEGVSKAFNEKKKNNTPFGVFYSEFGTLNTILELWPYRSEQQHSELNKSNNSNDTIKSSINNVSENLKSNITTKLFTLDEYINKK